MKNAQKKPTKPEANESCDGYSNQTTRTLATAISQDYNLFCLCKAHYVSGYKSAGALLCKLREHSPMWRLEGGQMLDLRSDDIKCSEITALLKSLYEKQAV